MSKKPANIQIVSTSTTEFMGYPVDLLRGLKGMGPALIGDDALYAAVVKYAESSDESGATSLGPALLTKDCTVMVQSSTTIPVPDDLGKPDAPARVVDEDETAGWDALDLDDLIALAAKHNVTVQGRVKTHGKLVAALESAGIAPPSLVTA